MLLGDYGADVLKIEHPRGDPARTHGHSKDGYGLWWKVLARNKRAVTLNLSHPAGRELLERLAADADVLIENFRPGVMEKWGLGPDRLHEINPALVMLRVTGFGQFGPYATRRAFGTLAEAMTGFAHQTGQADGPPTLPPFGLADGVAGLAGAIAVMIALYHRERNGGRGQVIDVSLIEPLLTILGPGPSVFDQLQVVPGRHGNRSPSNAPRNTYLTRDGRWVAISTSATPVAERVMRLVGRPDIAEKPWFQSARERVHHGDQLDSILGAWIRARDFDDVMAAFDLAGAAIAPVYDVEQLMEDPQVKAIDAITTIKDEDLGPLKMQNVMFRLSREPGIDPLHGAAARPGQRAGLRRTARPGSGPDRRAAGGRGDLMHRSYLFAPGHNAKLLRRVFEAGADAVILDLEDAVPPDAKQQARVMVAGVLAERSAWVRINTVRTDLSAADLDAVAGLAAGIRIPKAESADDVQWVHDRAPGTPLICAIESARGLLAAPEIAAVPGVRHLSMGGVDLRRDLGAGDGNLQTLYARSHIVVASRAAGLGPPIDSVYPRLDDEPGLRQQAEFARSLGFFGKSAIHPRQLEVIHDVFTPSEQELTWAQAVLDAFAAADGNAVKLPDGEFVDLPVADRARRLLELAGRRPASAGASG